MVEIEERAAKDLVHRPCWGGFRRHFTGAYGRCRFPPVHYLTKFQVWILLLGKQGDLLRDIRGGIDTSAGDEVLLLGD